MSSITIPILQLKNEDTPLVDETIISQTGFSTGVNTLQFQALYNLNQALQALEPAPNATTIEINNTLLCDSGTTGKTTTISDGSIIVNNNTGGTVTPAITLNQTGTGGGVLVEEIYNQRTAVSGEFNRMSFYAKATGGAKVEYARIHQNAPIVSNTTNARGRMDFALQTGNGTMTDYLTLNASTVEVGCLRTLNMNSQNINNALYISTPNTIEYGKVYPQYYTSTPGTFPDLPPYPDTRATLVNRGVPDTIEPLTASFPSTWGNIISSVNFNSYTYVGTDTGLVYYSNDGTTWNGVNFNFDGAIRAMVEFNGYLYFGGDFNSETISGNTCFFIAKMDSGNNFFQVNWANYPGSFGFNNKVFALCAGSNGYLYVGGSFDRDKNGSLNCPFFAIVDGGESLYCIDNSFGSGYGFNGRVNFIIENGNAPNRFVIGGEFTNISINSGGYSVNYNVVWESSDYNTTGTPYQVVGMNNYPLSATNNGVNIYIGGLFQGLPYGDYLVTFEWDGSNFVVTSNPYGYSATEPINLVLQGGGIFWSTLSSYSLYSGGQSVGISPTGSAWSALIYTVWSQNIFSTSSTGQNPIIAYYINTSDIITVNLTGGYSIQSGTSIYTGGITLNAKGALVDMIYYSPTSTFYSITEKNASYF